MSQEELSSRIREYGAQLARTRQVVHRHSTLLPEKLASVKRTKRRGTATAAKAERLALIDQGYIQDLEENVELRYSGLLSRIEYDTHLMLFNARQSLESFRRAELSKFRH